MSSDKYNNEDNLERLTALLGSNIRKIRKDRGYTINQLAKMSLLSSKYLQGVEVGTRNISIENINKIARSLGVLADDLLSSKTGKNRSGSVYLNYKISRKAKKELERIQRGNPVIAKRIKESIELYIKGDIKTLNIINLKGDLAPLQRMRVGDYRIIFDVEEDIMKIFDIRHRKDVYND